MTIAPTEAGTRAGSAGATDGDRASFVRAASEW